jgi:hypothetical protein
MRTSIHKWEVERIKEIVSEILQLWCYNSISAEDSCGAKISMSAKTFLEHLERDLQDSNK